MKHPFFNPDSFCAAVNYCDIDPQWTPKFPKPKPEQPQVTHLKANNQSIGGRYYVLHLSDWHYDRHYREGFEADCNEPICCRQPPELFTGGGSLIRRAAGRYGDFHCDTPTEMAAAILKKSLGVVPDIRFVIMTGDLPPHDIWRETQQSVREAEGAVAKALKQNFRNTKVYMAIGNHENSQSNYFPSRNISGADVTWLYRSLAEQWSPWIPRASQISMSEYGFYSVRRTAENLRIVSLNTNHAYLLNWWIFVSQEGVDPDNMLHWLINELQEAEDIGEDVYLIGHIPPGGLDVAKHWSAAFYAIVERYENTIKGQFYGHTHKDEFEVFYNDNNRSRPVSVAYLAPSITPFMNLNPGFRVYEIDAATNRVLDHQTWIMDLSKSNQMLEPIFLKEYSARDAFNLPDLSPQSWHNLTMRMLAEELLSKQSITDEGDDDDGGGGLLNRYMVFRHKSAPAVKSCDKKCRLKLICAMQSAKSFFPCKWKAKRRRNPPPGNMTAFDDGESSHARSIFDEEFEIIELLPRDDDEHYC